MRNDKLKSEKLISLVSGLPYFGLTNLLPLAASRDYLKIFLSRYSSRGKIIRLKKGLYIAKDFLDKAKSERSFPVYVEFVANLLCQPSYLSLDYVLFEQGILSESPKNFTSVSLNKTMTFSNGLGNFFYHKIKPALFSGFSVGKKSGFEVLKATKAKALFDFLYFRKNILINKDSIEELRLNLENMKHRDWQEFKGYLGIEGSKKMKEIFINLSEAYGKF